MTGSHSPEQVPVRVVGGPTTLIEYGGLRFLTDPTFDAAGDYPLGPGRVLTKTAAAPVAPADLGAIDAVLLSHDQHPDNLDTSGRALLADVPLVLTTGGGAQRLGGAARGLAPWESVDLARPDGGSVTVTATPAQHGPEGCEPITGEVVGFVLRATGLPTVHVSGDNASLDVVREIAERVGPVDTAVLFAGAARTPFFDGALVTLDGALAAEAARILGARRVVPAHCDSWAHFTEGRDELVAAFTAAGIADRLQVGQALTAG
jgi:L-ascorbate metabolism protein UlaG (beta-lactamase superfamily)